MSEVTLTFPFTILASGAVSMTTDHREQWADRVLSVVGTHFGERPFRPSFGSSMGDTTFENLEDIEDFAVEAIRAAFVKHLPYLSLTDVDVGQDFTEDGSSLVYIDITYIIPNGDEITTTATYGTLDGTGEYYDDQETFPLVSGQAPDDIDTEE